MVLESVLFQYLIPKALLRDQLILNPIPHEPLAGSQAGDGLGVVIGQSSVRAPECLDVALLYASLAGRQSAPEPQANDLKLCWLDGGAELLLERHARPLDTDPPKIVSEPPGSAVGEHHV